MTISFALDGETAIVTGGSRGIGRAIARGLAAQGANVVVLSRTQADCDLVAAEIEAAGRGRAIAVRADIGEKAELEALCAAAEAAFGPVSILVCNAASNPHFGPMAEISDRHFERVLRNNILSSHWLAGFVVPGMIARGGGSIIIVPSIGGLRGSPVIGAYNVSKAADFQLARNLAVEHGRHNIRVNCIAPGLVKTDFARALWDDPANLDRALAALPLGRIGDPEDIAGAAVFLASPAGRYITGQTLVVDGGATSTIGGL